MELKNQKLKRVKDALQYAVMYAPTESETAEYALLLLDVEKAIAKEGEQLKMIDKHSSLPGCVFMYCSNTPRCEGKCEQLVNNNP